MDACAFFQIANSRSYFREPNVKKDNAVTIRDRDTTDQVRIPISIVQDLRKLREKSHQPSLASSRDTQGRCVSRVVQTFCYFRLST